MKITKKFVSVLLALILVLATSSVAFARKDRAGSLETFLKASQKLLENSSMFCLSEEECQAVDLSDQFQTGRLIVRSEKGLAKSVRKAAEDVLSFDGWTVLQYGSEKATKDAYKALKDKYGEDKVFPDRVFQVDLPKAQAVKTQALKGEGKYLSWGIQNMGMDKVQAQLKKKGYKTPVKVAILDTGISYLDGAFEGRIVNGFDMVAFNPLPHDFNGHGTHCASTICEATPDNVKVMPVKTITAAGLGTILNVLIGLYYAEYMGADVINMSLAGDDTFGIQPYDFILKELYDKGVTTVVAAGNEGRNVKESYPSNSKYVITVGATKQNNRVDKEYSNFGSKVDFVAPGTKVLGHSTQYGIPRNFVMTGTSMATPHVSAACALIKCVYPKYNQKQVYNVLKQYAVDIEARGKDPYAGWGRIDLTAFAKRI